MQPQHQRLGNDDIARVLGRSKVFMNPENKFFDKIHSGTDIKETKGAIVLSQLFSTFDSR